MQEIIIDEKFMIILPEPDEVTYRDLETTILEHGWHGYFYE